MSGDIEITVRIPADVAARARAAVAGLLTPETRDAIGELRSRVGVMQERLRSVAALMRAMGQPPEPRDAEDDEDGDVAANPRGR